MNGDMRQAGGVQIRGVSMAYGNGGGSPVLDRVDLEIEPDEFVALIGPSGCGKTTLLNLVAAFFEPSSGEILLDGYPVKRPGRDRSMVFQDDAVFPWYTVQQNVEYGMRFDVERPERRERARRLIELVGLTGREDAYPRELSGGMRKRVDVARALAPEPKVLLMDEPFAALDAMTKARLQLEFLQIWEAGHITVLFVTHDIEEALLLADRVILMSANPGRLEQVVDVPFERPRSAELRTDPAFQQLRHDLTAALA